jgi:3-hydroxyacyl-[acyl-carrier-protein] dehydratase
MDARAGDPTDPNGGRDTRQARDADEAVDERDPVDPVSLLPHRSPFRFVDAVDEVSPGERAVARYRVSGDEAFLAGHFPGNPVFPGVIQVEALAQTGAIALLADARYAGRLPLFGGLEKVRFRRIVRPGDELRLEVEMERLSARGGWGSGVATVDGVETCRARLMFAIA